MSGGRRLNRIGLNLGEFRGVGVSCGGWMGAGRFVRSQNVLIVK